MKKLILMGIAGLVLAFQTGCASYAVTSYHNNAADRMSRVVQARTLSGGEPAVGVDWAAITPGYIAAWKSTPGLMTAATAFDVGAGLATGYYGYKAFKQDGGSGDSGLTVNGNNNTTYVNGSGTQHISIDQSSNP